MFHELRETAARGLAQDAPQGMWLCLFMMEHTPPISGAPRSSQGTSPTALSLLEQIEHEPSERVTLRLVVR